MALLVAIVGATYDLFTGKIPNWLTIGAAILGLLLGAWQGTFLINILGLFTGILIYWPFFALGYMGGGDVKLMGAIGCFVGVEGTILTMVLASLWGGIIALVALMRRRKYIRYGLAIGLGFITLQVLQWLNLPLPYLY